MRFIFIEYWHFGEICDCKVQRSFTEILCSHGFHRRDLGHNAHNTPGNVDACGLILTWQGLTIFWRLFCQKEIHGWKCIWKSFYNSVCCSPAANLWQQLPWITWHFERIFDLYDIDNFDVRTCMLPNDYHHLDMLSLHLTLSHWNTPKLRGSATSAKKMQIVCLSYQNFIQFVSQTLHA